MWLTKDVEIVDGQPILYIKSLNALVCSDLHLGYEGVMAEQGVFLPKANLGKIEQSVRKAIRTTGAVTLIVAGDIKNEFSKVHLEEFNEFKEFVAFTKRLGVSRLVLIKGNHDNFVDKYEKPFKIDIYKQEALFGAYLIFHGEELPKINKGNFMIMGHVHPAIAVFNKIGVKEKLKCFLYGKLRGGKQLIILPAMNFYAGNVEVNIEDISELSPVFGTLVDVNTLRAFCIGDDETLDFGSIENLR
ncbi:MAG: metallophosphoesterase [Candidatus Micrarchaeaceae archaeon]